MINHITESKEFKVQFVTADKIGLIFGVQE